MATSYYSLRIQTDSSKHSLIENYLNIKSNYYQNGWGIEVVVDENDKYFDAINYFIDILEPNFSKLFSIGITSYDISIWILYEYEEQCNLEFNASDLQRIGNNNINLNISCWKR